MKSIVREASETKNLPGLILNNANFEVSNRNLKPIELQMNICWS